MAITIYKYAYHVSNNVKGVGITVSSSSGGFALADFNSLLTNYYTIYQLQTPGSSLIHFDNLTDAYHNNLLNLQGGLATSGEDSSGLDAEYYHLDYSTYALLTISPGNNKYFGANGLGVIGWYDYEVASGGALYTFGYSLEEDSVGVVTLVNDEVSPGVSQYYGTDATAIKGWYDLASNHDHSGVYIPIISDPVAGYFPIAQSNGTLAMSALNGASFATADHTHTNMVDYTGIPDPNHVAVFNDYNTIEGDDDFTWASATSSTVALLKVIGDIQTDTIETNTKLGVDSFASNTTGNYNVAIGYQVLVSNTEGPANVAIGYGALYSNTTAQINIGIGYNVLYYNTIGEFNVAIGSSSLENNIDGNNNVAIGSNALNDNTSGSDNIAIGQNTLAVNTSGSSNIAFGSECLVKNITGSGNFAYGYQTMGENLSGSYNLGIGANSLSSNISGNKNIAIGERSLNENETGHYNIGIGYEAGSFESDFGSLGIVTQGSYNIFLGYYTKAKYFDDVKEVVIGHEAIGQGSNTTILGGIDNTSTYLAGEIYCVVYDSDNVLSGSLPLADSSITYNVMYDPDTGKLYYGAGDGGGGMLTAHQLDSATYHTVSGLTTGHFLKATSATTFGFAAHGLTYLDVDAAASGHTHTGYIDYTGTPANNQIAIFTDSNTVEGTANLTYDGTTLTALSGVTTTTLTTSYIVSAGDLWLIPNEGNAVYIGGVNYTSTQAFLYTAGTQTNIALKISSKGSGALYLGNQVVSGGGLIYFGDGVGGLNAKTSETNVVYYDSSTGLLTYGAASTGNVTLSGSTNNTVCTVTGANAITGETNLTFDGSTLAVTGVQTVTSTITASNFILSSDERLKRYIEPLNPLYLDIPYKQFELLNEEGQSRYGVVAQDIKEKYPELVREGDGILSVAYIDLLIREIVYLKDKVKKLESAIEYE